MGSTDDWFQATMPNINWVGAFSAVGGGVVAFSNTQPTFPTFDWGSNFQGRRYGSVSLAYQTNNTDWPPLDDTSTNAGVVGVSTEFTGVVGLATWGGPGVYGRKTLPNDDLSMMPQNLAAGVAGTAINWTGVIGWSNHGYGVLGQTQDGDAGIVGVSSFSRGVLGVTPLGALPGVEGRCGDAGPTVPNTPNIAGVVGTSNRHHGVIGTTNADVGVIGFSTNNIGVLGYTTKGSFAGYFIGNLAVTGTKAAVVPFPDGTERALYCMESPELWFEDFGTAKLKRGGAVIKLDADFGKVIKRGDYRVFLTAEGDCRGLYVRHKSEASFEVRESQGGKSSIAFCYRIVGRRRDITLPRRFSKMIPPMQPTAATRAPRKPTAAQLRAFVAGWEKEARARVPKGAKKGKRSHRRPNYWMVARVADRTPVPRARTK